MATVVRPELRKNNKYWVPKHRYYELKHFCLQYPYWKREYSDMEYIRASNYGWNRFKGNSIDDPTYDLAEKRVLYFNNMMKVEQASLETDGELAPYILKAVTEGLSYNVMQSKFNIPCSKGVYYDRYRRFFWLLNKTRD